MRQAGSPGHFARLINAYRALPRGLIVGLKLLIALACVALIGLPQLQTSLEGSLRYAGASTAEWEGTDNSLESARCLRRTGYWLLQVCEKDRIVPFSAEDPGQVLLLSLWGQIADRDPTVMDVARFNLGINSIALLLLAAVLASLGSFATSIVLLVAEPLVYLHWFGTAPHWALIGMAALQMILPLAIIARARNWLPARWTAVLLTTGLLILAIGSLLREAVGSMALLMTFVVGLWAAIYGPRGRRHLAGTVAILVVAVLASQSSRIAVATRDWAYALDAAEYPATHGMSHTLYIGLGIVPNKWGIEYLDAVGRDAVTAADPSITSYSHAYFRTIRGLYLAKWREDPAEMIRIYFEKLKLILSDNILAKLPPLGVLIVLVIAVQGLTWRRTAGDPRREVRLGINLVALGFVGLLILQCVLAGPGRLYSIPLGSFILVLSGIMLENVVAWGVALAAGPAATWPRSAGQSRL